MSQVTKESETESQEADRVPWQMRCTNGSWRCIKWGVILAVTLLAVSIILALVSERLEHLDLVYTIVVFGFALAIVASHLLYVISGILALVSMAGYTLYLFRVRGFGEAVLALIIAYFLLVVNLVFWSPVLAAAGQRYDEISCRSHMKTLALAFDAYGKATGKWPDKSKWCDILQDECQVETVSLACPWKAEEMWDDESTRGYAMNEHLPEAYDGIMKDMVVLFESDAGWNEAGGVELMVLDHHGKPGCNIMFGDGHVEFVRSEDISGLRWKGD